MEFDGRRRRYTSNKAELGGLTSMMKYSFATLVVGGEIEYN